ncbi:MAG: PilT/PilU family type 4a pilus ATPase [Magnetococcales bacterium]|nr:PilT/PilU family type 4a pilus ATPase [Magnetococcales bacterium]
MNLTPYLKLMIEKGASDLFFTSGTTVRMKLDGRLAVVGKELLTAEMIDQAAQGIMDEAQFAFYKKNLEIDFAIALGDEGRFRVNAFHQKNQPALVLRYIRSQIPTLEDLKVPPVLAELILNKRGLLLMVGGTGSGKSTTLAAMVDHRNSSIGGHILTIEDPVEFVHPHKKSIVNQREVGIDTHSYAKALKSSLREAPDVILIGEIRDRETMEAAMELAGTGHLAISTLHANNAYQALTRIINMFPQTLHPQLFMDLSLYLRAILSQRLVPSLDGKRRAAVEVMINTPHIAELILKGEIDAIKESMAATGVKGMQTFDQALFNLYQEGAVSMEEALNSADSRANLEAKIHFG